MQTNDVSRLKGTAILIKEVNAKTNRQLKQYIYMEIFKIEISHSNHFQLIKNNLASPVFPLAFFICVYEPETLHLPNQIYVEPLFAFFVRLGHRNT